MGQVKKTRCLKGRNIGFPNRGGGAQECPVEGCRGRAVTRTAMRIHFLHRHVRKTGIILEEGNLPHPSTLTNTRSEERRVS